MDATGSAHRVGPVLGAPVMPRCRRSKRRAVPSVCGILGGDVAGECRDPSRGLSGRTSTPTRAGSRARIARSVAPAGEGQAGTPAPRGCVSGCRLRAAVTDASVPRGLYVIGDSLAFDSRSRSRHRLPRWEIEENFSFARDATETARDLRLLSFKRAADDVPLPPVIHVSTGTADDLSRPQARFARRLEQSARGRQAPLRGVANIWRPSVGELYVHRLNKVLAKAEGRRKNLHVVDLYAMVEAHHGCSSTRSTSATRQPGAGARRSRRGARLPNSQPIAPPAYTSWGSLSGCAARCRSESATGPRPSPARRASARLAPQLPTSSPTTRLGPRRVQRNG